MNVYGELTRAQLENLAADPTLATVTKGRLWYRTDLTAPKIDLGGSADTLALLSLAQTLLDVYKRQPLESVTRYEVIIKTSSEKSVESSITKREATSNHFSNPSNSMTTPLPSTSWKKRGSRRFRRTNRRCTMSTKQTVGA